MTPNTAERVVVRNALESDVERMAAILGEFFSSHASALPSVFTTASDAERVAYVADALAKQSERFFVATLDDELVGVLSLEEVRRDRIGRQPENHVMIHLLAVDAAHRRRGVGTRIMKHAAELARARGFASMRIHVWEFNEPAVKLYESLGYATLSQVMGVEL